ncbi:hypothetical protein PV325_000374 [Microctonus aethiopoides]|nr:hypothetical protein PV325_000374 [Microctonus aethiopoides]KAK0092080.1 hypothetical protein PV326_002243 [Microctonus aethiopoides]
MDFTGSVGRIVEDPLEAMAIAESEGLAWRRTWRPLSRLRTNVPQVDDTIHANKPWFHKAINREKAALLVKGHSKANGIFLVRESRSCPGAFVLTYKFSDRIFHAPIHRTSDESGNGCVYTLDKGVTKFYDLVQLVDFYQLNSASLPTRLTQYVNNNDSSSSSSSSSPSNNGGSVSASAVSPASPSSTKPSCSPRKNDWGSSNKISPRS